MCVYLYTHVDTCILVQEVQLSAFVSPYLSGSFCLLMALFLLLSFGHFLCFFSLFYLFPSRCYLPLVGICHRNTQKTNQIIDSVSIPQYTQELEHKLNQSIIVVITPQAALLLNTWILNALFIIPAENNSICCFEKVLMY